VEFYEINACSEKDQGWSTAYFVGFIESSRGHGNGLGKSWKMCGKKEVSLGTRLKVV
jgi:hypothetical protein